MAWRGRGRVRAQPFGHPAKQEPFQIYPEISEYPDVNLKQKDEYRDLIFISDYLQKFWRSSPYHLGSILPQTKNNDKKTNEPLLEYMKMTVDFVPAELASTKVRRSNKKVRWDPQSDLQRLDVFEKLDQGAEGQDDEKEKKEDEDGNDEDDEIVEEEDDDSGDDYDKGLDFDDDEDDFNMGEDTGGDEGFY
ncbi:uncharacterized protein LOC143562197 [Bidens hawaiensis]|uniref:uncharacterized protein LOC143562197 n=1 Tax=Bidens hawaiensis TaxID=980011 RepID=UPI00404A0B14